MEESKKNFKNVEFDDLLTYVGEFGWYQKRLFILMIPFAFFLAWVYFSQIFITLVPDNYWCFVPEIVNFTLEKRLSLSIPLEDRDGTTRNSRCIMYDVNYTKMKELGVETADPTWPIKQCDRGWEFDRSIIPYASIATEMNWVCDNAALPTIAQSIFFVGAIFGGLIFGWVADRYGRIPALVGSNLVGFAAGVATISATNFWQFALCRFFFGFAFDNCFTMMYILVLEYVGPKWRTFVANMSIALFFTFAGCALPWIAYLLADWRLTCIATSVPLVLSVLAPWVLPESARWLITQNRIDEAEIGLKKIGHVNKAVVPDQLFKDFRETIKSNKKKETDKSYTIFDLFKTPRLRRTTVLLIMIWMAISLVFDGHVRNVDNLKLNVFVTFTVATATEFPADVLLILVLDRWGRRWLACLSMAISGVFSIYAALVNDLLYTALLAIAGRFFVNISYNIGMQYAAELLPTVVRAQGVALIHIMGYVANIIAPFVVYLGVFSRLLPLLVLGVLGILGGLLALLLPETLNAQLPQTLENGEEFGKTQGFWDMPCFIKNSVKSNTEEEQTTERDQNSTERRESIDQGTFRRGMVGSTRISLRSRKSVNSTDTIPECQVSKL